jgi:hypothetical protein
MRHHGTAFVRASRGIITAIHVSFIVVLHLAMMSVLTALHITGCRLQWLP